MPQNVVSTTRKTVTLPLRTWRSIGQYQVEHSIPNVTDTVSRLIRAGLKVSGRAGILRARQDMEVARKTITLPDAVWTDIAAYRERYRIYRFTDTLDQLVNAGLRVKVAIVGANAARGSL